MPYYGHRLTATTITPRARTPMLTVWISMAAATLLLAYELLGSAADLRRWNATMRRHEGR